MKTFRSAGAFVSYMLEDMERKRHTFLVHPEKDTLPEWTKMFE